MYVTLDLQPPFREVSHRWNPAAGNCKAYGTLRLVDGPVLAKVYFNARAEIDAVMAELTALRAEMPGEDDAAGSDDAAWEKHVAHANRDGKLTAAELGARLDAMKPHAREQLLYHIYGYCPAAMLSALEHEEQTRAAPEPAPSGEGGVLFPAGDDESTSPEVAENWRRDETAGPCKCGHGPRSHHLNQVAGELQYCNECPGVDDCAVYSPAETAASVSA